MNHAADSDMASEAISNESANDFLHKEYPKQFDRADFWKQIKRTVNGEPVSEADISLIISQIDRLLSLKSTDHLLDLGCGNAALASRLFPNISTYTGVDFSKYLLEVAAEFFQPHPKIKYVEADIRDVERFAAGNETASKVLIYGCIAYVSKNDVKAILQQIRSRLPNVKTVMLGNVPNQLKAAEFFELRKITQYQTNDPQSQIGVWWLPDEMIELAKNTGFTAETHHMPAAFYGHKYRFDIVLQS